MNNQYSFFKPLPYPKKQKEREKHNSDDLLKTINENLHLIEGDINDLKEKTSKIKTKNNKSFIHTQSFEYTNETEENLLSANKTNNRKQHKNLNISDLNLANSNNEERGRNLKIKSIYFYKICKYCKYKQAKR